MVPGCRRPGLLGVATGVLARTRFRGGTKSQRRNAILAVLSGLAGAVVGGVVVAVADGGPGQRVRNRWRVRWPC